MIEKATRYIMRCDRCGMYLQGTHFRSIGDTYLAAQKDKWRITASGQYCPTCAKERSQ